MEGFEYHKPQYRGKPIPGLVMRQFGNLHKKLKHVKYIDELRADPPNIVIAEAVRNASFTQNFFEKQFLVKKQKYVMNVGVYQQLWFDPIRKHKVLKPCSVKFANIYRPYIGYDLTDKTILVTRTGGIGDLMFIQPNLRYLKEKYPTCHIIFACGPQYHAMVETWDCIDELLTLPFSFSALIKADYHAVFEGVIERCEEAKTENAYNLFSRWLGLDLPNKLLIPQQEPKPDKVEACKYWLKDHKIDDFMIVQLRASSPLRTPRPQFWRNLLIPLVQEGHTIVITDAPTMVKNLDDFIATLPQEIQPKVFSFASHSPTLDFSIALTSLAKCSISPDSSFIHLATSMGIPAFGVYGAFTGNVRLTTYKNVDWIQSPAQCAPCFTHGANPCKYSEHGHPICYDLINVDECLDKIRGLLNEVDTRL